ncbi:MAG: hypothetical protein AAF228_11780 [Pseudomonadota bacterium]
MIQKEKTYYQEEIDRLGLSQTDMSNIFWMSQRTSQRYAAGDSPVPPEIKFIFKLLRARPELKELVFDIAKNLK